MTTTWVIGDLLTGARIQTLPVMSGSWSDVLNDAGSIECTVSLRDPDVRRLNIGESGRPGRTFLAAVDGDTILQAGPVWRHDYDNAAGTLTLSGAGMYSYFDRRVLDQFMSPERNAPGASELFWRGTANSSGK